MKVISLALSAVMLTGCSSLGTGMFRNELAVVPVTQELRFISFYGSVGIAAKIDSPASAPALTSGATK